MFPQNLDQLLPPSLLQSVLVQPLYQLDLWETKKRWKEGPEKKKREKLYKVYYTAQSTSTDASVLCKKGKKKKKNVGDRTYHVSL